MLFCIQPFNRFARLSKVYALSRIYRNSSARYKSDGIKVVLAGGQGIFEVNLALMLKKSNYFSEICIFDSNTKYLKGICADLNSIHTPSTVTYHKGDYALAESLKDANLVVVLDQNHPTDEKSKLTEADAIEARIFKANADICAQIAETFAVICPAAILVVAAQPVNSMTPLMYSIASKLNHNVSINKIIGFSLKDEIHANLLLSRKLKTPLNEVNVPITGGSSRNTIVPLLSTVKEAENMSEDEVKRFTDELRGMNENKILKQSAPLSSASALSRFAISIAKAFKGQEVYERSYVACNLAPGCKFFVGNARFGPAGLQLVEPLPQLSEFEEALYQSAIFHLRIDLKRADDYVRCFFMNK